MRQAHVLTTKERILEATLTVLASSGPKRLALSDVAAEAGVSRPTLYRWFASKEELLEAFGQYEQEKYDAGMADAIAGIDGDDRLDAVLRFIVEFQHTSSLPRILEIEPEHVVQQMNRVFPIMRNRLRQHFPGPDGLTTASTVARIALSHALIPDDDLDLFLAELRHAAGLTIVGSTAARRSHRSATTRTVRSHR